MLIHLPYLRLKRKIRYAYYCFLKSQVHRNIKRSPLFVPLYSFLKKYAQSPPYSDPDEIFYKKSVDFWILYRHIKKYKPKEVLECGGGISTLILAQAIKENGFGRLVSMEESEKWQRRTMASFPDHLKKYVDFILSPKEEYRHSLFRGVSYKNIPDRSYDFMYIDGPTTGTPPDNKKTFDADFLKILAKSENSLRGMIDNRKTTCYVLNKVIGKVRFNKVQNIGYISPCTKKDLITEPDKFIRAKDIKFNKLQS